MINKVNSINKKRQSVLLSRLDSALGPGAILTGEQVHDRSAGIWGPSRSIAADVLVRPADTGEVAAVLRTCNELEQSGISVMAIFILLFLPGPYRVLRAKQSSISSIGRLVSWAVRYQLSTVSVWRKNLILPGAGAKRRSAS